MTHVIKEQFYRNIKNGEIVQVRQELSNGAIVWEYNAPLTFGVRGWWKYWDTHMDDPHRLPATPDGRVANVREGDTDATARYEIERIISA